MPRPADRRAPRHLPGPSSIDTLHSKHVRATALIALLGLLGVTAFVYAAVGHFEFVNWDDGLITTNPKVVAGLTWRSVAWAWTTTYGGEWIPLTWLSRLADVTVFGFWAGGHHLTNVALHLINIVLVFAVGYTLTGRPWRSWLVAAIFAVHPLNVGSVAWVIERKGLLGATFFLLAVLAYRAYVVRPRVSRYLSVVGLMIAGLLAKPMAVTLPLVLLIVDAWPLERAPMRVSAWRDWIGLVREKLPLFGIALAASVITFEAERRFGVLPSREMYPFALRVGNAVVSYTRYLLKTCWPDRLAAFYPLRPFVGPEWWLVAAALMLLLVISWLVGRQAAARPYLAAGWCWYVVLLVPVIGFVQVSDAALADRFAYLPALGFFVMIVWGGADLIACVGARSRIVPPLAVAALLALAADARVQLSFWQNSLTLWQRSYAVAPDYNFRAHAGMADALLTANRLDDAIGEYHEALKILPGAASTHNDLGVALVRRNRIAEARAEFLAAIRLHHGYDDVAQMYNNLGSALARSGEWSDARSAFAEAVRLNPAFAFAHYNLGLALAQTGDLEAALRECLDALQREPAHADWHAGAARLLEQLGRRGEAIAQLRAALRVDPSYEPARVVLNALRSR